MASFGSAEVGEFGLNYHARSRVVVVAIIGTALGECSSGGGDAECNRIYMPR